MKKILLLLSICCFVSIAHAQRFVITTHENGDVYELKVSDFDKSFKEIFTQERLAKVKEDKEQARNEWRDSSTLKIMSPKLKAALKYVAENGGGRCLVTFYCDPNGKIHTVTFLLSASMYKEMSNKMLKEIYQKAMALRMNPECYSFDGEHDYAIDAVELVSRVEKLK